MKIISIIYLMAIALFAQGQQNSPLKLWYKQPAGNTWENTLPIGNGRLGAMIYGNVENEVIQLNEHTVWSGGPNRNDNPKALENLAEITMILLQKKGKSSFYHFKIYVLNKDCNVKNSIKNL